MMRCKSGTLAARALVVNLSPEAWNRLEQILTRFEEAWNAGRQPNVADCLTDPLVTTASERRALLIELVQEDLEYRLWAGEPVRVETYLTSYPELREHPAMVLDLIAVEWAYREPDDQGRLLEEYQQRFPEYRQELEPRLRAASLKRARPGSPALHPAQAPLASPKPDTSGGGWPQLPGYEVLGVLGRGGMGVVYQARHLPLNRVVALKMIRTGVHAGAEEVERFRAEAEAAARLQHPNIVQVYEVGCHAGEPYVALEYVAGGSLAQQLAGTPLPFRQAASHVETLARAVHAAHEKQIVHRDLKPANVLVAADGTLKVADFGLAKRLDVETTQSQSGLPLGTPSYMAPEQAAGKGKEIGPAADVYALGTILYEMITGRPPFRGASALETLEQVRQDEPVSPRQLQRQLPRDLETICLKCLHKEPARRYPTAAALADDLRRFRNGEPIQARPVSAWERGLKWARRRPLAATLAAVLLATGAGLVAGIVLLEEQRREAVQARRQADQSAQEAQQHTAEAKANYQRAEHSYRLARAAMASVLATIRADPRFREGPLEDVRKTLLRAEVEFYQKFAEQRGEEPAFKFERGQAFVRLAFLTRELGSAEEAVGYFRRGLTMLQEVVRDHPSEEFHPVVLAAAYSTLSHFYQEIGRSAEAEEALQEAARRAQALAQQPLGSVQNQINLAGCYSNLGRGYQYTNRAKEAEQVFREALALCRAVLDQDAANFAAREGRAKDSHNLATVLENIGRLDEAERAYQEAIAFQTDLATQYPTHPKCQNALAGYQDNLGAFYHRTGRLTEAEKAYRQAEKLHRAFADKHPTYTIHRSALATNLQNLGLLYQATGRPKSADVAYQEALTLQQALADQYPTVTRYRADLARTQWGLARRAAEDGAWQTALTGFDQAAGHLQAVLTREPRNRSAQSLLTASYGARADALTHLGRFAEALADLKRGLALGTKEEQAELRILRSVVWVRLGRLTDAVAEAKTLAETVRPSTDLLYNAACVYALASATAGVDAALAESYATRAVALLRQAVAKGYRNWASLQNDADLTPLQSRADFQELRRELEVKVKSSP